MKYHIYHFGFPQIDSERIHLVLIVEKCVLSEPYFTPFKKTQILRPMKILIVEDNPSNFLLLQKLLIRYGDIDNAIDGESAVEKFKTAHQQKQPYDAIFLDIMLPKKDGNEVLNEIRSWEDQNLEENNRVQIAMTTAISDTDTVIKSYSDGCQHYLLKPFNKVDIEELMVRIGF